MMKLKIGDQIVYRPWGKEPNRTTTVLGIEICKMGEKYGRSVKSCDLDKHGNGTLELNDNHWCYFDQVKRIIKK